MQYLASHLTSLVLLVSLALPACSQAVSGDTSPVRDPAIIQSGKRFYLFCTGRGIPVRTSADMKVWTLGDPVFAQMPEWVSKRVPNARAIWAPDISKHGNLYWLYYSVSSIGRRVSSIGLAVNRTLDPHAPDYHWMDKGPVLSSSDADDWNAIDPQYVCDEHGAGWLAYGSYWSGIWMRRIDPETGFPLAGFEPVHLASRPSPGSVEGVFIVRRGDWFYQFASHDFTGQGANSTYKVVVGRSRSATGEYFDRDGKSMLQDGGTLVVAGGERWRGTGHNSAIVVGGKTYLAYHAVDMQNSAKDTLCIAQVHWTPDGWPEVQPQQLLPEGYRELLRANAAPLLLELQPNGKINGVPDGFWSQQTNGITVTIPQIAEGRASAIKLAWIPAQRLWRQAGANGTVLRQSVIGRWEHRVGHGPANMIQLLPDGYINTLEGADSWILKGDILELHWKNAAAPGGVYIDSCKLDYSRSTYAGGNQNGVAISGRHVSSN